MCYLIEIVSGIGAVEIICVLHRIFNAPYCSKLLINSLLAALALALAEHLIVLLSALAVRSAVRIYKDLDS